MIQYISVPQMSRQILQVHSQPNGPGPLRAPRGRSNPELSSARARSSLAEPFDRCGRFGLGVPWRCHTSKAWVVHHDQKSQLMRRHCAKGRGNAATGKRTYKRNCHKLFGMHGGDSFQPYTAFGTNNDMPSVPQESGNKGLYFQPDGRVHLPWPRPAHPGCPDVMHPSGIGRRDPGR